MRAWIPLALLVAAALAILALGGHRYLTLEAVAANRDALARAVGTHYVLSLLLYAAVYIVTVALSLPGGSVLTLLGGLLFGWAVGGAVAVVSATAGAIIVFLVARSAMASAIVPTGSEWLDRVRSGFKEDALSYLLFLRLIPAFPFWLVNLAPALLGVPLRTYVMGTFLGILPGSFAFASVGAGLDSVIVAAKREYAGCVAAHGAQSCALKVHAGSLLTNEMLLALVLLGIVAIIPVFIRKRGKRSCSRATTGRTP